MLKMIAVSALIVAGFTGGALVQLAADAAQDCKRDKVAFKDACQFTQEHPTLTAFVNR